MPDARDSACLTRLQALAKEVGPRTVGRVCGALLGALAGWYGALAGFAMGAMLDAARLRQATLDEKGSRAEGDAGKGNPEQAQHESDPARAERLRAATLLGVPPEADSAAIKRAFRRISRASHPDGPDPDPERFMAAKQAAESLLQRPN